MVYFQPIQKQVHFLLNITRKEQHLLFNSTADRVSDSIPSTFNPYHIEWSLTTGVQKNYRANHKQHHTFSYRATFWCPSINPLLRRGRVKNVLHMPPFNNMEGLFIELSCIYHPDTIYCHRQLFSQTNLAAKQPKDVEL